MLWSIKMNRQHTRTWILKRKQWRKLNAIISPIWQPRVLCVSQMRVPVAMPCGGNEKATDVTHTCRGISKLLLTFRMTKKRQAFRMSACLTKKLHKFFHSCCWRCAAQHQKMLWILVLWCKIALKIRGFWNFFLWQVIDHVFKSHESVWITWLTLHPAVHCWQTLLKCDSARCEVWCWN